MIKYLKVLILIFLLFGCKTTRTIENDKNYKSDKLVIQKITDHVYQHTSFLETENFGKVPCNGVVFFDKKEAVVFDTPTDDAASLELINWVEGTLDCQIMAIIPTHTHADCLGGLAAFHKHNISSYANNLTIALARMRNLSIPKNGFDKFLDLTIGNKNVIAEFCGEGHTKDNIIGYFPREKVMFGGCLIKESGAGKGNLEEANIQAWSATVAKVKEKYPDTKIVIPGHGKPGGTELLDYTFKLFEKK
jgi:metallo-beta-lactamase class B